MAWHYRILGLLSFVGLLSIVLLHRSQAQISWQPVRQVLSAEFQQRILKENLQPGSSIDIGQMKVLQVRQSNQRLYLIDTRIANSAKESNFNLLCGAESCLFLGYFGNQQRVLNIYLNPKLPPKVTLIQPIAEVREHLPCLVINQLEQQKIRNSKLCFNGTAYEIVESQILPEVYE